MNLSIYKKLFLFVLLTTPLALMGDGSITPSIECVSYDTFPLPQCQTNTPKIKLRTENGVGEDANFEDSKRLIIQVNGPNDNNDFNDVNIITQKPLINQGKSYLERENGTVVLKEGQQAATNLKQKDAIIIVNPSSGVRNLDVNASSGAAGQDAGNVVVVADNLENLSLTADGYHGQNGESVSTVLAKRAMGDPSGDMHEGIADSYLDRRESDQNLPLDFDSLDLNNYAASGLQCRPDETAVGGPGSYAYETSTDPGSVPEGIAITSLAREQTKRSFCRRDPEFSVTQECQAEKEYSFQAVCSVIPEGRSVRFNKRKEVRWQRAVCASDVNAQVRRKIVRSANIEISIPGMKSYSGTIQREITFAASYNVYKRNSKTPEEGGGYHDPNNPSLVWYSPFWKQDENLASNATIQISPGTIVPNAYTAGAYPDKDFSSGYQKASKLAFIPRPKTDGSNENPESLFSFLPPASSTTVVGRSGNFEVQGCAKIIDIHNDRYPRFSDPTFTKSEADYQKYMEYFLSFDSNAIGFNDLDLFNAGNVSSGGIIRITSCYAYEVMDGVVQGDTGYGSWALVDGTPEPEILETSPLCVPGESGTECSYPEKTGSVALESSCPASFPNAIGSETLIQYEREGSCYIDDPRDPPIWLKLKKAREKNLTSIPNLFNDNLVDLSEGGDVDRAVGPADFTITEYSSSQWYREGSGTGKQLSSSPLVYASEFQFPESMTSSDINAITNQTIKNFCVHMPNDSDWYDTEELSLQRLTKAASTPEFAVQQSSGIALPTGVVKRICTSGIRLDRFLSNVPRPSCSEGTSTKLYMSKWSSGNSEGVWKTWSEIDQPPGSGIPPLPNHSVRTEFIETRYDDLPPQIVTSKTHEVHPAVSIPAGESFTGNTFPPSYGFTEEVEGSQWRKYQGWLRESNVTNQNGAFVTPNTFAPFSGLTQFDRATQWCNAEAFVSVGSRLVKGFGAKGVLRDVPKHVFGFTLNDINGASIESKEYVGIEIIGTSADEGFFAFNNSSGSIYKKADGSIISPTDAGQIHQFLGKDAFKVSNYPYIGAKFAESCTTGQKYNEFTGFCHDVDSPWKSSSRTVERIQRDGTKAPYAINLKVENLQDTSGRLNVPFSPETEGTPIPEGDSINPINNPTDWFRLGFLRPMKHWSDENKVPKSVILNRPETFGGMTLSTGFATSKDGFVCGQRFRMIAVPVPTRNTPFIKDGRDISVEIDPDNYLRGVDENGKYWGPVFIAVDTNCDTSGLLEISGTIKQLGANGEIMPSETSSNAGFTRPSRDVNNQDVTLSFYTAGDQERFRLSGIKESLAAGMSATTGEETLRLVELAPPTVRNRASEWSALNREKGGKGWQGKIKTTPTPSSSDQNTQPLSCNIENLRGGIWGFIDSVAITNGNASLDCEDAASSCSLTEEELSLFTKPVSNSKAIVTTRPAAEQFTPWSYELPENAPKSPNYAITQPFGEWTVIQNGSDGSSVPSCEIFNGQASALDVYLPRSNFDDVPKVLDEEVVYKIKRPDDPLTDFMMLPENEDIRKSEACLRWDSVTGKTCEVFHPSLGGPETTAFVFGGTWKNVFVETKERVSQECSFFKRDVNGHLTATCSSDFKLAANSVEACTPGSPVAALCAPCAEDSSKMCAPYLAPKAEAFTTMCTPGSCVFPTNSQSYQVEASIAVSGQPGQDGTNSGTATIFCRDCDNITFSAQPGTGGVGSPPISSQKSKTLTCVSWNHNPLAPQFSIRNLWSQPFVGGSAGQNGRPGSIGGTMNIYSDLTPEAIFQLTREDFWLGE